MKKIFLIVLLIIAGCTKSNIDTPTLEIDDPTAITPLAKCENGFAGEYPCKDYDLVATLSLADLDPTAISTTALNGNDSWGWTDPSTEKEYALVGLNSGVSFVDISNPVEPIVVGFLPTATVPSDWRDVKVYKLWTLIM